MLAAGLVHGDVRGEATLRCELYSKYFMSAPDRFFVTGGPLRPDDPSYVERSADLADPGARARLSLYRRVLRGVKVVDAPTSPVVSVLKLTGVVRPGESGALRVSNRVYRRLFDRSWIRSKMPVDRARRVAVGTLAASLLGGVLGGVAWYAWMAPRPWIEQLELASEDLAVAARAHEALSENLLFPQAKADELLAGYWDRRARAAAVREDRDQALLYRLRAVEASDTEGRRRHAAHLVGSDWQRLGATMRHDGQVSAAVFSPDGKTVLTGSSDATARLWSADSGAPIGEPMRHRSFVLAVAFSPDGQTVLTGSIDGSARLWRSDSSTPIGGVMTPATRPISSPTGSSVWPWSSAPTASSSRVGR